MLEFKEKIDALPQDNSAHEGQKLIMYAFIRSMKPERVVEIGTHLGVTALYLAHALYDNKKGHLWTCDPYDYKQEETFSKFPELKEYITFQKKKGEDLDIDKIDFLFVDGFHEKHCVLAEIKALFPRLTKEAVVFFHDAGGDNAFVGVNEAIREAGLKTLMISGEGKMRLYSNYENFNL